MSLNRRQSASNSFSLRFLGRSTFTTAARPRVPGVHSSNRTDAVLVLVVLPAPRERLPSVPQDRTPHPLAVDPQGERRHLLQGTVLKDRAPARLQHDRRCPALCSRRLQRLVVASDGLKYSRSAILFTNSCTNVDATISLTHCFSLKWTDEK